MPFNFQLLVEFFFSGLITLVSILLLFGIIDPTKTQELIDLFYSASSGQLVFFVFIGGLISYYLGTVVNATSNKIIREFLSGYRIKMIRRKLGLNKMDTLVDLDEDRKSLIDKILPKQVNESKDQLKEFYTAARNYCGTHSEQTSHMVSYHWGLLRLSRATILPLILFCIVVSIRLFMAGNLIEELFFLGVGFVALILTIVSYRYREKFLIYTVFDIFFISQKIN